MLTKVHLPSSAEEAVRLLAGGGWLLGGGTVVMPRVNTGAVPVESLISLRHAGLDAIRVGDGTVDLGAAVTLADLGAHDELAFLRPVVRSIASPPVRNLATVGGNLFAVQPHGDLAVALLALDAEVHILGAAGTRTAKIGEPIGRDELVTGVHFGLPAHWRYRKAMRRKHNSASIVTVAAVLDLDGDTVRAARIALGGVAPRPVRAHAAEQALVGNRLADAASAAGEAAREGTAPFDDAYASAWYRTRVLPVHVRRALLEED